MAPSRRPTRLAALTVVLALTASGCGSDSDSGDAASDDASTTVDETTTTTTEATTSTTAAPTTAAPTTTEPEGLEGASLAQRSAPAEGDAVALLGDVRIGSHDGYERVVFEFTGTSQPAYTAEWVDGPILADGSGIEVEVAGAGHLVVRMEPASGVDLSGTEFAVIYEGPDRLDASGRTSTVTEVVRTGDFEAVLTWVIGATEEVPFRVTRLADPARLVIDLEAA